MNTGSVQPYAMPAPPDHQYGVQRRITFTAGEAKPAQLLEGGQCQLLWRVTAYGTNCTFRLSWGTYANNLLVGLRSPLAVTIPGAFTLQAEPVSADAAMAAVGALSVASGGISVARSLQTTLGVLSEYASKATALAAGTTVTVGGNAVVLGLNQSVELCWPAALTVGGPLLLEHAL
jgi:hypothetical protein